MGSLHDGGAELDAVLAVVLYRARLRGYAVAVAVLTIATIALGAASVLNALPLGVVLSHNFMAALLLATLVATSVRLRASRKPTTRSRPPA